jgi:5-methylcytosine-specific restriction endonuclease McrA
VIVKACTTCGTIGCKRHARKPQDRGRPAKRRCRTRTWRNLREQVLTRDGYRCSRCGERNGLQAHHLRPGDDTLDALTTLCRDCHKAEHGTN